MTMAQAKASHRAERTGAHVDGCGDGIDGDSAVLADGGRAVGVNC